MAKSTRYLDRNPGIRKWSEAEMAREKSVQDEIDAAAKRYRRKELACKLAIFAIWLAIGFFLAYQLYQRSA